MNQKRESFQRLRHFIWDFDGTLFDAYPVIIQNLRDALARYSQDADPVEAMGLMLRNIPYALTFYADKYGIRREELKNAYEEFHKQANADIAAKPMAGVREVLERICETGRHNYIFTHRKLWETKLYLEKYGLKELFRELIGPESSCFAAKPAPDAVLYLMETFGMDPEETVMIGDREIDLGSGRNAGVKAMHLVCKAVPEDLACDWQIDELGTMLEMLE
ncbi:MAG: HAD-IA family hydrolase [Oscillospiraceae bacterium]|nr:HAD-IA family hydrolase [Oscillospiraceae bacterium]